MIFQVAEAWHVCQPVRITVIYESDSVSKTKDPGKAPVNKALGNETKIRILRDMFRIRRFEQTALKYYNQGRMGGFLHLYTGQESVAVGTVSVMGENDHVITAYRDHGHALAVGMTMNECMAELFGKEAGCSRGKGGSMHFFAPDKRYWGGHGIVAGQTPLGAGIAFALKYKGVDGACLTFLGDGAVNQGVFHETLNLAALWDIPVVFIIENNKYSMGTSQKRSSAYEDNLATRAEAYAMDWSAVNGEDILEIRAATAEAIARARETHRPTLIEIATYRYYGHSVADANTKKYRTAEEIEKYRNEHDPLRLWRKALVAEGVLSDEDVDRIDDEAKKEAGDAAAFADESPYPPEGSIYEDVYWEVDNDTEAGRTGTHFFH